LMVGREVLLRVKKDDAKPRDPVLSVRGLTLLGPEGNSILDNVSFEVRGGETLGIAGVEGNGQTELIEILAGLQKATGGDVLLESTSIDGLGPRERKRRGIAHIPEYEQF